MKKIELKIAHSLAWSFHRRYGLEYEELFAEACLGYAYALSNPDYNPTKMKFSTFVHMCIWSQLQTFVFKDLYPEEDDNGNSILRKKLPTTELEDLYLSETPSPYRCTLIGNLLASLTSDAKFVVRMVLDSPVEFISLGRFGSRRKIKQLLEQQGLLPAEVEKTFKSIKEVLSLAESEQ